jgi:hypothetical protein
MKKYFLIILIMSVGIVAHTQTILFDNEMITGIYKIIFNGTQKPTTDSFVKTTSPHPTDQIGGGSNICDSNGNLILFTDGFKLYDNNLNYIDNGDSLTPPKFATYYETNISSQSTLFLPFPNHQYYLFTPTVSDVEWDTKWLQGIRAQYDLLLYHKIDMNANNGAGKVVKKGVPLLENVVLNKTNMMACKHGDGINWWLFKQAWDTNMVYKFLVTADSIYNYGTQSFPILNLGWLDLSGQTMFNNEGTQYAICIRSAGHPVDSIQPGEVLPGKFMVADFDRCSGEISNPKVYQKKPETCHNPATPNCLENATQGLCFSPNGRFIYVTDYSNIKQLDLWDSDTNTQWSLVAEMDTTWNEFQTYSSIYPGPDGRIYVGNWNGFSNAMSAILYPDNKGAACGWSPKYLRFKNIGVDALPCMPNYHLGKLPGCATVGVSSYYSSKEEFEVYPNPSSTKIVVRCRMSDVCKELYNSIGQLVLSTKENEIDVYNLSRGIYYLKVGNVSSKLVVE